MSSAVKRAIRQGGIAKTEPENNDSETGSQPSLGFDLVEISSSVHEQK
jgi:hypothetical protein